MPHSLGCRVLALSALSTLASAFLAPQPLSLSALRPLLLSPSAPRALNTGLSSLSAPQPLRNAALLPLRAGDGEQEMSEAEKEEYEKLLAQAKQLQNTFDSMIGGAFGDEDADTREQIQEEVQQVEAKEEEFTGKGFNIPIMDEPDYESSEIYTPDVPTEEPIEDVDPETLSEEDRVAYNLAKYQRTADAAFEACEQAIEDGDFKKAKDLHNEAVENYSQSGILHPDSIFRESFIECLDEQKDKIERGIKVE